MSDVAEKLKRAGIEKLYEVLLWVPQKSTDNTILAIPEQLQRFDGQRVILRMTLTQPPHSIQRGRFRLGLAAETGEEFFPTVFGPPSTSPWKDVERGQQVSIATQPQLAGKRIWLNRLELVDDSDCGKIVPIYRGKPGVLGAKAIKEAVGLALEDAHALDDCVLAIRQAFGGRTEHEILDLAQLGGSLKFLLWSLHRPPSKALFDWALGASKRLAIAHLKQSVKEASERAMRVQSIVRISPESVTAAIAQLPFQITQGNRSQQSAIEEIVRSLAEPVPMDALLTADVGAGKTVAYMVPAVLAQQTGVRVAVLIPNLLLAKQIEQEFRESFPATPVALIAEGVDEAAIEWAANPVLIGTTKLFGIAQKREWLPGFLIVDEQQKLGVAQREGLCGPDTNLLECSATPMPETFAKVAYGARRRIEIDKQHARKVVHTVIARAKDREAMFAKLTGTLQAGGRVAIIYPVVQEESTGDRRSVEAAARWFEGKYPGKVVALHGKLSPEAKQQAIARAKSGECPVIISSTILEIGITIRDLKMVVVVNADRFGVSTLHQIRGRLVRSGGEGWFYAYVPDPDDEGSGLQAGGEKVRCVARDTLRRIELLKQIDNGFDLAEADMKIRGFGDLLSGETSNGKSKTLFRSIDLMPEDFERH